MAATSTKKTRSGRRTGSFSFVLIPLEQLNKKFADQTTPIKVSRLWAQECGFTGLTTAPAADLTGQTQGQTPSTKVGATETELD